MSTQVYTLEQVCRAFDNPTAEDQMCTRSGILSPPDSDTTATTSPGSSIRLQDMLRHLVTTLTLPLTLDEMLHLLATLTMQAMRVDLCVILLKEASQDVFWVYTWSPDLSDKGVTVQSVTVEENVIGRLRTSVQQSRLPRLSRNEQETLNPLKNVYYENLYPVPLFAGADCIGLLNCYSSKTLKYTEEEELTASLIASQAALAIRHRQYAAEDALAQRNLIKAFVDDLFAGKVEKEESLRRRANFLGYDLTKAHAVALIELSEVESTDYSVPRNPPERAVSWEERLTRYHTIIRQIKQYIQDYVPGSLTDERDNLITSLLCLDHNSTITSLTPRLDGLIKHLRHEYHVRITVGIGTPCTTVNDYCRGLAEAKEALEIGQHLPTEGACTHFNALGAYRYIYTFAQVNTLRDQYQSQIDIIVEYDRRKKTNLLDTLETYLECGGNVAKTSNQLEVHRNTLLQRLDRLQKLCTIDLEIIQNRLPLLIALKVYKLRMYSC